VLVDAADAARVLPPVAQALGDAGIRLRGCEATRKLIPAAEAATDEDWGKEYLDHVVAVRVVDGIDGALQHIARYGSNHTEVICTNRYDNVERFMREADASCVLVNASTRFNDGGQLGLGAEIGISTAKMHAYGPMGIEHLTTEKWVVFGEGQIRA
jgi:glutamate-5-semialdehyde dehydrogenase